MTVGLIPPWPRRFASTWSRLTSGLLGRGAVSFLLATAGVNASNFLFHIVMSRLVGPARYGVIGALLSILSILAVPVGAIQMAITQAVIDRSNDHEHVSLRKIVNKTLSGGIAASLFFALCVPALNGFLHTNSIWPLLLVAMWIPLAAVGAALQGALIGQYRFREVAFATFIGGGPLRLLAGAAMALLGLGVSGAVIATIVAQLFTTSSLLFSSRREIRRGAPGSVVRSSGRDMILSVAALGGFTALFSIDTFLARHFFQPNTAGQYAAGAIAAHIALFVPSAIIAIAFPRLADGKGTGQSSRRAFFQAIRVTTAIGLIVAIALAEFSSPLIRLLFGSKYVGAVGIIGPLALASAATGISSLFVYLHLARRSVTALIPWVGVALVTILIALHHQTINSVAVLVLAVSLLTLFASAIPAIMSFAKAATQDKLVGDERVREFSPSQIDLSLVVPFYNPGSRLGQHIAQVADVLSMSGVAFEILAVSDGSTDHSEEQLAALQIEGVTIVRLKENQGKGEALRTGLAVGRGAYLGFIDGDGDLPANLLTDCLRIIQQERPEIIFGSKRHPKSEVIYPPLRRMYSWVYQQLIRLLFHLPIRDTQTGIKVIRRDVLVATLPLMIEKRFAFDLELFVVARQEGFSNFYEMPVSIGERFTSTISPRAVRGMLLDTFAIYYRLRVLHFYDRNWQKQNAERERFEANDRLRIAMVLDTCEPFYRGGYERRAWEIARILAMDHHVTVFTSCNKDCVIGGVSFISIRKQRGTFSAKGFRNPLSTVRFVLGLLPLFLDNRKFDVVDCNATPFLHVPIVARLARHWRASMVLTAHEGLAKELEEYVQRRIPNPLVQRPIRKIIDFTYHNAMRQSDLIIVPSQYAAQAIRDEGHLNVLTNLGGVSYRGHIRDEYMGRATFVGRLVVTKRVDVLIRVALGAARNGWLQTLTIVGTGPQYEELQRLAGSDEFGPCIRFVGEVDDDRKFEILRNETDVFISASTREGISLVTLEAMAMGIPVIIASSNRSVPNGALEYVRHGENGIITYGDEGELLEALHQFKSMGKDTYRQMSAASSTIFEDYSWERGVNHLLSVYKSRLITNQY